MVRKLFLMLAAAGMVLASAPKSEASTTLAVGTLAPNGSPWWKKFQEFKEAVKNDTNGDIILDFRTYSSEKKMYDDIEGGLLAGGAMTAVGLSKIYNDILVFQLPGLFATWKNLDNARNGMKPQLDKAFADKGYTVLGWGDVGAAKIMSVQPVTVPADLNGKATFILSGDAVGSQLWPAFGVGITEMGIGEVHPRIPGTVNFVVAPPLVLELFQWASKLDNITGITAGFGIGALVFKTSAVPAAQMGSLQKNGGVAAGALTTSIRNADAAAYARLKTRKNFIDLSQNPDAQAKWSAQFKVVRDKLCGTTFSAAMCTQVANLGK